MGKIKDAMLPLQDGDSGYIELHGEDFFFLFRSDGFGISVKVTHEAQQVSRNYIVPPPGTREGIAEAIEDDWIFWFGGNLNVWSAKKSQCPVLSPGVNLLDKPHSAIDPLYSETPIEGEAWLDENGWLKPKYERLLKRQEPWKR